MTSGCIFKNGAPTQVLRKERILTKFDLCYTMRENVRIRKMQILFILFDEAFFIDVSILSVSILLLNHFLQKSNLIPSSLFCKIQRLSWDPEKIKKFDKHLIL